MTDLTQIKGIGPAATKALADMGIKTVEDLAGAAPDQVASIRGISPTGAAGMIAAAGEIAGRDKPEAAPATDDDGKGQKTKEARKKKKKKKKNKKRTKEGKKKKGEKKK